MATARKLPSGNYRVNLFIGMENGKRKYKSFTAHTKKEAELLAAQYNLTRKEMPRRQMSVSDAAKKFIDDHTHVLAPSTVRSYNSIKNNYFKPIQSIKLSDLTSQKIQSWVNDLSDQHSPKTVRNIHAFLSSVLSEYAPEMSFDVKLPKKTKKLLVVPEEKEVEALLNFFADDEETKLALTLAAVVGMRRGEICALEWADLQDKKIFITKALSLNDNYEYEVKAPKTYEGFRVLLIPESLEKKILTLKKDDRMDERIFHFTPNALTDRFIMARRKLGFKWRLHDLRHYNASVMLSIGVPDKYAMQRMGHATTNMLKTVYQHTFSDREKEIANIVNGEMERLIK